MYHLVNNCSRGAHCASVGFVQFWRTRNARPYNFSLDASLIKNSNYANFAMIINILSIFARYNQLKVL